MQVPGLTRDERRALEHEAVGLLSRLLQADTTNPPGNETRAALVLREYFAGHGLEAQLVGDLPERQNLVVRLPGARPGPRLGLLGHLDVVPAEADEWTVPPFAGAVRDGYVWGRGATDMKNQVAAEAVAVTRLARAGAPFAGELLFIATADEERGDYCGARWLATRRPELVRCDYLLNEGGGTYSIADGVRLYPLTVGEKAFADFRITVRGRGGHGSVPLHDLNAVERLGRVITAIAGHEAGVSVAPFTARYIERLVADRGMRDRLKDPALARAAVRELHATDPESAYEIEPLLGMTFSPTIVRGGGEAVNVIPSHASVDIDCRILPGHTPDDVRREVDAALAGDRRLGVRLDRPHQRQRVSRAHGAERGRGAGHGRARPGLRGDAAAPVRLHRFALVSRSLSGHRRLRVLPVRGRGLGDDGRPRARPGRTHRRRRPALPGALLRASRRRAARLT